MDFECRVPARARRRRSRQRDWLVQAGLADLPLRELLAVVVALGLLGALAAYAVFGGLLPAVVIGVFAATFPLASYRRRRIARRAAAMDAWPRLLEELRILTSSLGRSIPQALFEVGRRAPDELRPAFVAAHREWLDSAPRLRGIGPPSAGMPAAHSCRQMANSCRLTARPTAGVLVTLAPPGWATPEERGMAVRNREGSARRPRAVARTATCPGCGADHVGGTLRALRRTTSRRRGVGECVSGQ